MTNVLKIPDTTALRDIESIEQANSAWVRTLSRSEQGLTSPGSRNDRRKPSAIHTIRARADHEALWARFHDPVCHEALETKDSGKKLFLTVLERGRIRVIGANTFPGVGRNMVEHVSLGSHSFTLFAHLEALAFIRLKRDPLLSSGVPQLQTEFGALDDLWERLAGLVEDQAVFGREVMAFLTASPKTDALMKRLAAEAEIEDPDTAPILPEDGFPQEMQPDVEEEPNPLETIEEAVSAQTGAEFDAGYRAYTTAFDQTTPAEALFSPRERLFHARKLDRESIPYRRIVTRLARRLMRQVMAWQRRSWMFDQDEGSLDPRRLTGLVADPMNRRIFMQETQAPFPATVVSLLLDNSGSMKGRPIQMAAMTMKILSEALERCGVRTEILGYTTRAWNGGRAREQWQQAGSPVRPGRLNEVLHMIYKSAETPWRRARHNLGIMLHPDLLKENIDGEALRWAWRRLLNRPEPRRILIVICDGDPHDEATVSGNGPDYMARHLRSVIARIERSSVQLAAIGVGQPVGRFYTRAVFLEKMENLAEKLSHQLLGLLSPPRVLPFG